MTVISAVGSGCALYRLKFLGNQTQRKRSADMDELLRALVERSEVLTQGISPLQIRHARAAPVSAPNTIAGWVSRSNVVHARRSGQKVRPLRPASIAARVAGTREFARVATDQLCHRRLFCTWVLDPAGCLKRVSLSRGATAFISGRLKLTAQAA